MKTFEEIVEILNATKKELTRLNDENTALKKNYEVLNKDKEEWKSLALNLGEAYHDTCDKLKELTSKYERLFESYNRLYINSYTIEKDERKNK